MNCMILFLSCRTISGSFSFCRKCLERYLLVQRPTVISSNSCQQFCIVVFKEFTDWLSLFRISSSWRNCHWHRNWWFYCYIDACKAFSKTTLLPHDIRTYLPCIAFTYVKDKSTFWSSDIFFQWAWFFTPHVLQSWELRVYVPCWQTHSHTRDQCNASVSFLYKSQVSHSSRVQTFSMNQLSIQWRTLDIL